MKTLTQDQIDAVIDWMNNWEQLEGTAIPLRFKEDWTKQLNLAIVSNSCVLTDRKGEVIRKGSIIDINQTVNGQRLFVVTELEPLEVSYAYDLNKRYEYDKNELVDKDVSLKTIDVKGNVYDYINNCS